MQSRSSFTRSLDKVKVKHAEVSESRKKRDKVNWTENDYEKFVKIVRRHGRDWKKLQLALKDKTLMHIKRFTKVLIKQIKYMKGHPEDDILEALQVERSAEEEKERKRKSEEKKRLKKI